MLNKFILKLLLNYKNVCQKITCTCKLVSQQPGSILDYFIVCRTFLSLITKMIVDKEKKYSLTKFSSRKGEKIIKESDHNMLILQLNLRWSSLFKSSRLEIYNFNNKDDFKRYQLLTENNVT